MTGHQLAVQLLFQIALILTACRLTGWVARRFGQPQVVAEMITGVILGPSLLGLFWPQVSAQLFPPDSMKVLYPLSQFGLAAYMFVVGLEFRIDILGRKLHTAAVVSAAGMLAPFALGALLAVHFFHQAPFFSERTTLPQACIFLGASMCITAFPMLARILVHKKLTGTTMGTVSLGAGALDDVAAWCLLALVLAAFDGDFGHAYRSIGGGIAYGATVFLIIRPLLARWAKGAERRGQLSDSEFSVYLIFMALGAWFTDMIGLHAVFGAFTMGAAMPRGVVSRAMAERIQPFTVAVLLPFFFTYSGLNTQIALLNSVELWIAVGLVLLAAIAGKGGACFLAARATGLGNSEALGIGTLMNARGLMELIIINIGLQRGIITPSLFAVLVIMAIFTTLMASPVFDWLMSKWPPPVEPGTGNETDAMPPDVEVQASY
jgi:Kef-type K+ transport system membrane component KefB